MPPSDGFLLFSELQKARQSFVLETELHAIYLVTPFSVCYQLQDIDWLLYLDLWEKLSTSMQRVGEVVGVKESFLVKAMRGGGKLDQRCLQIHKRFYTALALQELINESPMNEVAIKYKFNRGTLQSLQQTSSTFAGIVKSFCIALNWEMLALIVSQMKDRIFFGVHQDLVEIMKIPILNSQRARALYNAGYHTLIDISKASLVSIEKCLFDSISFDVQQRDGETNYDAEQRNKSRLFYVTGKNGLTVKEAAKMIIDEARRYLRDEMGIVDVIWSAEDEPNPQAIEKKLNSETENKIEEDIPNSAVKRRLSHSRDSEAIERSGKRSRIVATATIQISSESTSNDDSDVDSVNLDSSISFYNDEDDDFMKKFKNDSKQTNSRNTLRLEIIDVNESLEAFDSFVEAIGNVNECGFSLAVCRNGSNQSDDLQQIPIAGIAFCFGNHYTVHYLNFQDNRIISFERKIEFIRGILLKKKLTLEIDDAKAQLKTLMKFMPNIYKIDCNIDDPRIAHWLLKPDAERTFCKMVRLTWCWVI